MNIDKVKLRADLKNRRFFIPNKYSLSCAIVKRLEEQFVINFGNFDNLSVGVYWPLPEEVDIKEIFPLLWERQAKTYLPKINSKNDMNFIHYDNKSSLFKGKMGIMEVNNVSSIQVISPSDLSVVIVPMLGFSDKADRIGMGGGYYDRTFDFKKNNLTHKPILVGVAFAQQQILSLSKNYFENFDVPMDIIVTDKGILHK